MSERSDLLLLEDILDAINNIRFFTKDISFTHYISDLKTKHAVERNFLIIGEAVSRLSQGFKERFSHVNWRQIKHFRNIVFHYYFGVDHTIRMGYYSIRSGPACKAY